MDPKAIVILCTAPVDDDHAARLARGLVDARLAACVNLVPGVRSFYRWKGNVEDDAEVQLVIKTRPERFEAVAAWLDEHHPYDEPEILALPVTAGSDTYLSWVEQQT
jgi:periplasmic divalent cation tolerance protein